MKKNKVFVDVSDEIISKEIINAIVDFPELDLSGEQDKSDICIIDNNSSKGRKDMRYISVVEPVRIGSIIDDLYSAIAFVAFDDVSEVINLKGIEFNFKLKLLSYGGNKSFLTEKEANILLYLYKNLGATILKKELLEVVWGYNPSINTRTLETHVYRLRQKILDISGIDSLIITDDSGYKLDNS